MFEQPDENPSEQPLDPKQRAQAKSDEFRMHAELAAVFEATRKFDARILPRLDPQIARDVQKTVGRLEKSKLADTPVIQPESVAQAAELLDVAQTRQLSTNDYHVSRRPGEVMILRWLDADQVQTFYERLQAHFDAALNQFREDERQALGWRQDPQMQAYLDALDAIDVKMEQRYLRPLIREKGLYVLSTQSADEMDILHLTELIMGIPPAELVGSASAPPEQEPTISERAWYFKLFSLRGAKAGVEQMCFFTYLQKSDAEE